MLHDDLAGLWILVVVSYLVLFYCHLHGNFLEEQSEGVLDGHRHNLIFLSLSQFYRKISLKNALKVVLQKCPQYFLALFFTIQLQHSGSNFRWPTPHCLHFILFVDKLEKPHQLKFYLLALFDEFVTFWLSDNRYHLRPAVEFLKHSHGKQVYECYKLLSFLQLFRDVHLRKRLKLNVEDILLECHHLGLFLAQFYLLICQDLVLRFFTKQSTNTFLLFGLLHHLRLLLLHHLLLSPGSVVLQQLRMPGWEVLLLDVIFICVFDTLQYVIVRIEVVGHFQKRAALKKIYLVTLLEEQSKH